MSLVVWLPLDGDLRNLGTMGNYTFSLGSAGIDNEGKIGKCYKFTSLSSNGINLATGNIDNFFTNVVDNKSFSMCGWLKTSESYSPIIYLSYGIKLVGGASTSIGISNNTNSITVNSNVTTNDGKWHHICGTYSSSTRQVKIYVDGINTGTGTLPGSDFVSLWRHGIFIGRNPNNSTASSAYFLIGSLNDVRIYDHCLSAAEVREIAQGLVLHYKLNDRELSGSNLIINGFGELGTENWSNPANFSTDIPNNNSAIKKSIYSNTTKEYIPITSSHTYELSVYLKNSATSGTTYPSLYPYDIDQNFIATYNCREGFNLSTMTTLTQQLKPGDTKIYVNSLANWNANSGHYYNYAAIFDYKDSTGHIYEPGTYTRNTPVFGSSTNAKTNLDKTNNIITLNSAYTGTTVPIGTSICAATAGSTYYYPFGGVAKSSINSWTFKTATIIPQNINRLKEAKYIKYSTYDGTLHAGIKLIDLFYEGNNIIQDSSGYGHNGEIINELHISNDTARYNNSTLFDGVDDCIIVPYNKVCPENIFTINLWFKKDALGSKNYETLFGGPSGFEMDTRAGSATSLSLYMASTRGSNRATGITMNEWHMITMTRDGTTEKYYVDGEFKSEIEAKPMPNGVYRIGAWASNTGQNYYGLISDFRIYCTPLLDKDIKLLYNTSMRVDNSQGIHSFEFDEIQENLFRNELISSYAKSNFTTRIGEIVYHNDAYAMNIAPAPFYQNLQDNLSGFLLDCFEANTSYTLDMWIDVDSVIYNGNNVRGGLQIVYSDGTSDNTFVLVGGNKGYQHKKLITPANKTIKRISVHYYTSTDVFYRLDSYICKTDTNNISKTGITTGSNFIQSSKASVAKGGEYYATHFIEN